MTSLQRRVLEMWAAEYEKLADPAFAPGLSEESRFWKLNFAEAIRAALAALDDARRVSARK
jgi:hypothetical protein